MVIRHHLHNSPLHLALESDLQFILLALAIYLPTFRRNSHFAFTIYLACTVIASFYRDSVQKTLAHNLRDEKHDTAFN